MPSPTCPSHEQISDFALGRIAPDIAATILDHLARCEPCTVLMSKLESADSTSDSVIIQLRMKADECGYEREAGFSRASSFPSSPFVSDRLDGELPGAWLMPGDRLREYLLLEKVGAGGMGAVYRAQHTKLKRTVAVKVLPSRQMANSTTVTRFLNEMEAVGRLQHPHVVHATDAGEIDGIHFLVMEYVDGLDLRELTDRYGPRSWVDACSMIRQAATGLQCAHEAGLVHRDIKPSNLMVDKNGRVRVLDLGLASLRKIEPVAHRVEVVHSDQGSTLVSDLVSSSETHSGTLMGTVEYMAPEQAANANVDHRADIYSLGCTMFRLVTGKPLFVRHDAQETVKAHCETPPPSLRQGRQEEVPAELDRIFHRMVAKRPDDRFSSMAELVDALDACPFEVEGEPNKHRLSEWRPASFAMEPNQIQVTPPVRTGAGPVARILTALSLTGLFTLLLVWFNAGTEARGPHVPLEAADAIQLSDTNLIDEPTHSLTSPDGQVLASIAGNAIMVWNGRSGDKLWHTRLKRTGQPARSVKFSSLAISQSSHLPWIAAGATNGQITIWNYRTGQQLQQFTGVQHEVSSLAFSPNGHLLAVGTVDQSLEIWRWEERIELCGDVTRRAHSGAVRALCFSPDGKHLASGGTDKHILLRPLTQLGNYKVWRAHNATIGKIVFSPNGRWIVSASDDGKVAVSNTQSRQNHYLLRQEHPVQCLFVTEDNRAIACFTSDGKGRFFECNTWRLLETKIQLSKDKKTVLTSARSSWHVAALNRSNGKVRVFHFGSQIPIQEFSDYADRRLTLAGSMRLDHQGSILALSYSADGRWIATGGTDGKVIVSDAKSQKRLYNLPLRHGSDRPHVRDVAFGPAGKWLASCGSDGVVFLFDMTKTPPRGRVLIEDKRLQFNSLSFSVNGRHLAVATNQSKVFVVNISTGKESVSWRLHKLPGLPGCPVSSVVFAHDGRRLFSCGDDRKIIDQTLGGGFRIVAKGIDCTNALAISPNGEWLAAAGNDSRVHIWHTTDARLMDHWNGHSDNISAIAFSHENYLAVAGGNGVLNVFNVMNRKLRFSQTVSSGPIHAVAFAPNGRVVATAGAGAVVDLWHIPKPREWTPKLSQVEKTSRRTGQVMRRLVLDTSASR